MEQIKPDKRYILAQPEDLNLNISLKSNFNDLNEFNNTRIISLAELFTKERNESTRYRIYGNINFLSFLRNKKTNPTSITDLFNDDYLTTGFNFEDFFDIKLFRLSTIQTYITNTTNYVESLTAITNDNDYKLSYYGFSRNIYNEKNYNFKFDVLNINPHELKKINNDLIYDNNIYIGLIPKIGNYKLYEKIIDTTDVITEIDLNTKYGYVESAFTSTTNTIVNTINNGSPYSLVEFKEYFLDRLRSLLKIYDLDVSIPNIQLNLRFIRNYLDIGNGDYKTKIPLDLTKSTSIGNLINFNKSTYTFTEKSQKEYLIVLTLTDTYTGNSTKFTEYKDLNYSAFTKESESYPIIEINFSFKFKPFHKIELKKYDSFVDEIYSGVTTSLIPSDNAVVIDNKTIWRDLLQYGDPDNYDNPFMNNTHYFFNDINFYIKPDLSDRNTGILINEYTLGFTNNNFIFNKDNLKIVKKPKEIC